MSLKAFDLSITPADTMPDKIVKNSLDNKIYVSVERECWKNGNLVVIRVWKVWDIKKMRNAIDIFKFTHLNYTQLIKYSQRHIRRTIKQLKKDLMKKQIFLYELDDMGILGHSNFDLLQCKICHEVEKEHSKAWTEVSFVATDDLYILGAMQIGELHFLHNIVDKDTAKFTKVMRKYIKDYQYSNAPFDIIF